MFFALTQKLMSDGGVCSASESRTGKIMPSVFSCSILIFVRRKLRPLAFMLGVAIFLQSAGCHPFSFIPVTVKEVKDYALGRQQSFSYPLIRSCRQRSTTCIKWILPS